MPPTNTDHFATQSQSQSRQNTAENNTLSHFDAASSSPSSSTSSSSSSSSSSGVSDTVESPTSPSSSNNDCQLDSTCNDDDDNTDTHKETIIVFDWDDTLLSSSWLAGLGYRLDSNMSSAPVSLFATLETLAKAVIELLRLAASHGRVVVITNAETGWVELSAAKFIPSVVPVLAELQVQVFSARSTFEAAFPDAPLKWKSAAFEHVLSEQSATASSAIAAGKTLTKNVLSLGDSHVEREAVRQVTAEMMNTLCKSVKFAERPNCEQLTRQLTLVHNCFRYILNHQNHLDLQLTVTVNEQSQQQAREEEEKMRCQEQSGMASHDDGCGGYNPNNTLCMDEDEEEEEKVLEAF